MRRGIWAATGVIGAVLLCLVMLRTATHRRGAPDTVRGSSGSPPAVERGTPSPINGAPAGASFPDPAAKVRSPPPVAGSSRGEGPTFLSDPFANAQIQETREDVSPVDPTILERTHLLRTDFKYPLLRVLETVRRDPSSHVERLLARVTMVADHLLVKQQPGAGGKDIEDAVRQLGGEIRRTLTKPGFYLVSFASAHVDTVSERMAASRALVAAIEYAEPDYVVFADDRFPNDPQLNLLWGLNNTGQTGGTPGADISAPEAWSYQTGGSDSVIAVLDTGIDYTHEDLRSNIWTNTLETANGLDDDGNGYVDDVHGWNFVNDTANAVDDHSHGSHVSGTIAAVGDNNAGVVGVNWRARILPLKFLNAAGSGATSDAIEALHYVTEMRRRGVAVRVTNNSWGGTGYSSAMVAAIAECGQEGILFVAAAGNDGVNTDTSPHYPSSYSLSNIIAVAATDSSDNLASFSNYGLLTVHMGAPGQSILSTTPGSAYGSMSGTSMATPHVAGVAALAVAAAPQISVSDLKQAILSGADPVSALSGVTLTGGRLNAVRTLLALEPMIVHVPVGNTFATNVPYAIEATIVPIGLLDTNRLWLSWNTTGATNGFSSNRFICVTNSLYRAEIPAQPVGTDVFYWLEAETVSNRVTRHPSDAPNAMHSFRVTRSRGLIVGGSPDNYGTVSPGYGADLYASGAVIHAWAEMATVPTSGHRFFCTGWTGGGSVPAIGTSNEVSFILARDSAIFWQWIDQYALTQTSTVAGVLNTTSWWRVGASAETVRASSPVIQDTVSYSFAGWEIGGARQPDPTSCAVNPAAVAMSNAPVTAVAVYLPSDRDNDLDGLPDWWELFHFASLSADPIDDPDGDGYINYEEYQDGSDPRDPGSTPSAPAILHTPLTDPQSGPAPWTVTATITDNTAVATASLYWKKNSQPTWRYASMTNMGGSLYVGAIPAPGIFGDTFVYRIDATDAAGYLATGDSHRFFVAYPVVLAAPASWDVVLKPGQTTNLTVSLANSGNTNFVWSLREHNLIFSDDMESGEGSWTHDGPLDLWHLTTHRSSSATHSWYCGADSNNWRYRDSTHASLIMPRRAVKPGAILQFRHWIRTELNDEVPGEAWDGGIIEVSTNSGASYDQVTPVEGYPYRITPNPASPFAAGTPCLAGTGGWERVIVDLAAYSNLNVTIRFRFGADGYVVEEGWYIDDVRLVAPLVSGDWLAVDPTYGTVAASASTNLAISISTAGIPGGTDAAAMLEIIGNDPVVPTNPVVVVLRVRSEPTGMLSGAAQTSTNGEGYVTVTQTVADVDGEVCSVRLEYSLNGGGTWTDAKIQSVSSPLGGATFTNSGPFQLLSVQTSTNGVPVANPLRVVWDTRNSAPPVTLCANALLRARIWDGIFWDQSGLTGTPFLVDNEGPTTPIAIGSTSHVLRAWSANSQLQTFWNPCSDGAGIGVAGYWYGSVTNRAAISFGGYTTDTQAVSLAAGESTSRWVCVATRDLFGNTSDVATVGPFWIDTLPPSADGATVSISHSACGNYVVGNGAVTSSWSGFTDGGIGVAGYFCGFTNAAGTTNGIWTADATAVLTGAELDRTNCVYVWARDALGWIGSAATATVLVLRAESDQDGDGMSNGGEEIAGTDATVPGSVLAISSVSGGTNASGFMIRWHSAAGRLYSIVGSTAIGATVPWTPVATNLMGTGGLMEYTDTNAVARAFFYRIAVHQP